MEEAVVRKLDKGAVSNEEGAASLPASYMGPCTVPSEQEVLQQSEGEALAT